MLYRSKLQSGGDETSSGCYFQGQKQRRGCPPLPHPCLPWGWREDPPPCTQGKAQP